MSENEVTAAATFCATVVDEWARAGITDAVVCPGSRSTPMALALEADPRVRVHVHHDERAAGFVALGLGLATGLPAPVVTTSGTAAVELHPAVVEAHHARVPLVAVTADRPPELRDVGAPQTIDQRDLYGTAVRWYLDPGVPDSVAAGSWRSWAARTVLEATIDPAGPGPVQLNLPFRDPLVGRVGDGPEGRANGGPWHGRPSSVTDAADLDVTALADAVAGRRGVIVAGAPIEWPEALHALAARLRWPVLAEPRSGCRLPREATVSHFDALLRSTAFADRVRPDVVLRFGSLPASKVLGEWLAGLDAWQLGVDRDGRVFDPSRTLASVLAAEPSALCEAMVGALRDVADVGSPEGWYEAWIHADAEAAAVVRDTLSHHAEPTEPAIARDVLAALPDGANLVVSSSMPIRDLEWFGAPREGVRILANRGANGIDGVVSTAVGVALSAGAPTAVLVGDVALLHDTNALLGLARRPVNLCVVVVDNDGGGIFEFLPPAEALDRPQFELLFGTPHGVDLAAVARAHGLDVSTVAQQAELRPAIERALAAGGAHVVIASTDRQANTEVHRALNGAVAEAVRVG